MITKIAKKTAYRLLFSFGSLRANDSTITGLRSNGVDSFKEPDGSTEYIRYWFSTPGSYPSFPANTPAFTNTNMALGITVGSGTTPATEDDYKLESLNNNFSGNVTWSISLVDGNPTLKFKLTLTNTSGSSQTISEICYKSRFPYTTATGTQAGGGYYFMIDRTVFTPITFAAGETKVIYYTITSVLS